MNTALWHGTPFQSFAVQAFACPTHRLMYFIAQVEQTVYELFGVGPENEETPDEARQVALIMLATLQNGYAPEQLKAASEECTRIVNAWRKKLAVH